MNLRETLRKFGKHVGINIGAVRTYAKQLLIALRVRHSPLIHISSKNMLSKST
jgi:serine/threonine-protein kinase PRP4